MTFVQIKAALVYISPLLFNVVRMVLAASAMCLIFHKDLARLSAKSARAGAVVGGFLWLGYEFQTTGLKFTSASKSAFLTGICVVLVPLLLAVFFRRHVNRWVTLGALTAFTGLYLMAFPAHGYGAFSFSSINVGDMLSLVCAVMFGFQIIFIGRATRKYEFRQIATVQILVCAILMAITVPIVEKPYVTWNATVIWAILVTALLCTALAFSVQAWAQQFTPPTHTALIFSMEPVFAGLASWFLLGERLGFRGAAGGALILGGVLLSELKGSTPAEMQEETADEGEESEANSSESLHRPVCRGNENGRPAAKESV
jgi:drug/metabolite transporter (DMT)-like permease